MPQTDIDLGVARDFLIALAIGGLVGIEREMKKQRDKTVDEFGGIRTYIVLALVGATSAWLTQALELTALFAVAFGIVGAAVIASYLVQNRARGAGALGLTGELAAVAVFMLAAMAVLGAPELAVALSVVVLAVLAFKEPLHGAIQRLGTEDLFAGVKLLIASFVVLPLLPNQTVDPWGAINPYTLWLLVVLVSALSLVGYAAMRWLGTTKGLAVTGVAGGMVSSTATTMSLARASRTQADERIASNAIVAAVLLAWLVMFARVIVLVGVVNFALLPTLWLPVLVMAVVCAAFAAWHYRAGFKHRRSRGQLDVPIKNPFSLTAATKFGLLFAAVLLIVKLAQEYGPQGSVYLVAALSGTVDVDAITLSMAEASDAGSAATAIVIAMISNTVVKAGLVVALGSRAVRLPIITVGLAITAAGIAVVLLA
jgi:uncharacterized membrane protein (DUF4010 family)